MIEAWFKILRYWPIAAVVVGLGWFQNAWAAILLYHAGIVVGLVLRPRAFASLKRGWNWPLAGVSVIAALGTFGAVILLLGWIVSPQMPGDVFDCVGLGELPVLIVFAIYFSTIHPVLEELCWRELVHPSTARIHLRDFEFAAYHVVVLLPLFPGRWLFLGVCVISLVSAGWTWRILREKLGGLAIPAFSHALADLAIIFGAILVAEGYGPSF